MGVLGSALRQQQLLLQGTEQGVGHGVDVEGGVDVQQQHRVVHGDHEGDADNADNADNAAVDDIVVTRAPAGPLRTRVPSATVSRFWAAHDSHVRRWRQMFRWVWLKDGPMFLVRRALVPET